MADNSMPVTNPALVQAIETARQDSTEQNWAQVVRAAMAARFLTPIDMKPQSTVSGRENTFSLHMLKDSADGKRYYLAFTDLAELNRWRRDEEQRVLVVSFDDYSRLVLDGRIAMNGFVINPYGGNVVFNRAMLEAIRRRSEGRADWGSATRAIEKGAMICLGQPSEYPAGLEDALRRYFRAQAGVREAYLLLMDKDGATNYLVAVDFDGAAKPLFDGIGDAVSGFLGDMSLNLVPCDSAFWREAANDFQPFYRKSEPLPAASKHP